MAGMMKWEENKMGLSRDRYYLNTYYTKESKYKLEYTLKYSLYQTSTFNTNSLRDSECTIFEACTRLQNIKERTRKT